jgi:hypothetical protein
VLSKVVSGGPLLLDLHGLLGLDFRLFPLNNLHAMLLLIASVTINTMSHVRLNLLLAFVRLLLLDVLHATLLASITINTQVLAG